MSKIARRVGTRAQGPEAPVEYELSRDAVAEVPLGQAKRTQHYGGVGFRASTQPTDYGLDGSAAAR